MADLEETTTGTETTDATATEAPATESAPAGEPSLEDELSDVWDQAQAAKEGDEGETGQERDEQGRFKAKESEGAEDVDGTNDDGDTEEPGEADPDDVSSNVKAAPGSWRKAAKLLWDEMPDQAKEEIWKREKDSQRNLDKLRTETDAALAKYEGVDAVLSANQEIFDRYGRSPREAVATMVHAQKLLDNDPMDGLVKIAASYGIDLPSMLTAGQEFVDDGDYYVDENGNPLPDGGIYHDPRVDAMAADVEGVREYVEEQQAQMEADLTEQISGEIAAIEADTENFPYFSRVRGRMSELVASGHADTYEDAYRMAVATNAEIRKEEDEAAAVEKQIAERRARQAERGKRAAGLNVNGDPVKGKGNPTADETIEQVANRLYG